MCGIFGIITKSPQSFSEIKAHNATSSLKHRGPDQKHHILIQEPDSVIFVATQRLNITGGKEGIQPIYSSNHEWIIQLNGEIYNYQTLKRQCISNGIRLQNNSDTAVVAALLEFIPISKVLSQLRGMFALSIIHVPTRNIWLFRDRMGVKPLYWYWNKSKEELIYASEVRSIKEYCGSVDILMEAVQNMLVHEYIPAPLTIYKDIYKLRAGHHLEWNFCKYSNDAPQCKQWYSFPTIEQDIFGSLSQWEKSLDYALDTATRIRCAPEIPTGILLSGGIDSALIAHYGQKHLSRTPSKPIALHVSIEGTHFDEKDIAKKRATQLQIPLHIITLQAKMIPQLLHSIYTHLDEPIADSSILPTFLVMEEAKKEGITILLSGDGADESFGGYPTYQTHCVYPIIKNMPQIDKKPTNSPFSVSFISSRLGRGKNDSWWKRHQLWMGAWLPQELPNISDTFWETIEYWIPEYLRTEQHVSVSNIMQLDQRSYLSEGVLAKVDRASGAYGIEVRSPFLDQHIVELGAQIPLQGKIWKHRKGILRKILHQKYPYMDVQTPKKGFGSPISHFLRTQDLSVFYDRSAEVYNYVSFEKTQKYYLEHKKQNFDYRKRLWSVVVLDQFLSKHGHQK